MSIEKFGEGQLVVNPIPGGPQNRQIGSDLIRTKAMNQTQLSP